MALLCATEIHLPTEKAPKKEPPSQKGRERERRQGTGTPPRRNRPAPVLHIPSETSRRPHRMNSGHRRLQQQQQQQQQQSSRQQAAVKAALANAVAAAVIPTVSSLHRWRLAQHHGHDPRAEFRGAQARCPDAPIGLLAQRATTTTPTQNGDVQKVMTIGVQAK